jgi:RNA polymerase sigma factor (sigma-70 family)
VTSATDRFRALFDEHHRAVLGYALRRSSPADAADVLAETMLVAWRRIDEVPADPGTRPWLFGVAHKTLANQRRGTLRRDRLRARVEAAVTEALTNPMEPHGDQLWVRAALLALDVGDREVLTLTAWEGLTPTEIAGVLDVPAATVRTRLHRARARLREELGARNQEEVP